MSPFDWEWHGKHFSVGFARDWRGLAVDGWRSVGPLFWRVR